MSGVRRIALWSGPRNVSTALMYAFAQRADTRVVDEPLYAAYLERTGMQHPGREEVLASQERDAARAIEGVVLGPCDRPVFFQKQMAHHLVDLDWGFLDSLENCFLIRHPGEVLQSFDRVVPDPRPEDVGLGLQVALLEHLRARGADPAVVDSRLLLEDPPGVLARLCERLGIAFDAAMLRWEAGARPEDGVWAPHWYSSVHTSTGFAAYRPRPEPPERLSPTVEACLPDYERLLAEAQRLLA